MKKSLLAGLSASVFCLLLSTGLARAQDPGVTSREGIALQNQILSLQSQMQQLQASVQQIHAGGSDNSAPVSDGNGGGGALTAQLLQRVSTLEQQVRDLTGQLQQLQNQVTTQNGQLNKQIGDLTFQMQNGGKGAAAPSDASAASAAPPSAPQAVAAATPETLLQDGNLALHQGKYKLSEGIARELLAKFPRNPRAYEAQFLLAQSLQGQQRYQDAALAFDDTYNRNHKGSKAPNALLGLAMTLAAINQNSAACSTLKTLHSEFPKPPSYLDNAIAATHKHLGC